MKLLPLITFQLVPHELVSDRQKSTPCLFSSILLWSPVEIYQYDYIVNQKSSASHTPGHLWVLCITQNTSGHQYSHLINVCKGSLHQGTDTLYNLSPTDLVLQHTQFILRSSQPHNYITRKMISSGGASLCSWHHLYSRVFTCNHCCNITLSFCVNKSTTTAWQYSQLQQCQAHKLEQPGSGLVWPWHDSYSYTSSTELENGAVIYGIASTVPLNTTPTVSGYYCHMAPTQD